jgi:uncharacterized membrane protein YuzA (DUF378 family)
MRPQNTLDWIAFVFLIIGAFAWGFFVTDTNILDGALEAIAGPLDDPLDDLVFILIFLSGLYWIFRAFGERSS